MKINIDPKLKPLYANLLRLGIEKYLISKEFKHLCLENDMDQLWDSCEDYIRSLSNVAILISGYTGDAEKALGIFLTKLENQRKDKFLEIMKKIIVDFAEWSSENKDFSEVRSSLLDLGYAEKRLNEIFSEVKQKETPVKKLTKEFSESDFWNIIHADIIRVAKDRFEHGHYADAVESAFKEINKRVKRIVKNRTGEEWNGKTLMFKAFSVDHPIISLDNLSTMTGKDIQEGYGYIFAGVMQGIRNPKAHNNINITKERGMHFIFLASLLMYKLDKSK